MRLQHRFTLTIVIVDEDTGRPHIAVRREHIALFARMIRTRQVTELDSSDDQIRRVFA